jgi:hypothetical protein
VAISTVGTIATGKINCSKKGQRRYDRSGNIIGFELLADSIAARVASRRD